VRVHIRSLHFSKMYRASGLLGLHATLISSPNRDKLDLHSEQCGKWAGIEQSRGRPINYAIESKVIKRLRRKSPFGCLFALLIEHFG
jgi:hypothetical protein